MGMWHLLACMLQMVSSNKLPMQHQAGPEIQNTVKKLHEECLSGGYVIEISGHLESRLHALTML